MNQAVRPEQLGLTPGKTKRSQLKLNTVQRSRRLSVAETEALGAALEALRAEVVASLGAADAAYIRKVQQGVRYGEIGSRALLMVGGWVPPLWLLGTVGLGLSKIVENMELGHNVMHGQFDWLNDDSLRGSTYEWDNVCAGDNWRHSHNFMHHTYTNVVGKDRDVGYGLLRLFPEQYWVRGHLLNVPKMVALALWFEWAVGIHDLDLIRVLRQPDGRERLPEVAGPFVHKIRRQLLKDYVFFPVLAGPMAVPVLAGNLVANIMRNVWSFTVIFCGHFTQTVEVFDKSCLVNESRSEWYVRQLRSSSNIEGGRLLHFLSGNLSHQIEHHLFPDLPANRYGELAVKVRALCEQYDQQYSTGSLWRQFGEVVQRAALYSLPNPAVHHLQQVGRWLKRKSG